MSDNSPLTPEELAQLGRLLSDPLSFPTGFKQWVTQWVEANPPQITLAQIAGSADFTPFLAVDNATARYNNTTYGDPNVLGSPGPTLSGLPDGHFIVGWGASSTGDRLSGGGVSQESVLINGSTSSGDLECQFQGIHAGLARFDLATLTNGNGANTLKCQYLASLGVGHEGDSRNRWLLAIKYSNL